MSKHYLYTRLDGSLDVLSPVEGQSERALFHGVQGNMEDNKAKIALSDIPDTTKARVARLYPDETDPDRLEYLWRTHILYNEYTGPPVATARAVEYVELPYHITSNGDPAHGMCYDPNCHDRYFRNACEDNGVDVVANMDKCRVVHMDRIRLQRNKELTALDVEYIRALEQRDIPEQLNVSYKKQILRDLPQTFDLSIHDTPENLKAAWPAELNLP